MKSRKSSVGVGFHPNLICCFPRGAQASSARAFPSLRSVVPISSGPAPYRRKLVLILTLFSYLVNTIKNRGIENNRSAGNTERLFINIVTRGWGTPRVTLIKRSPSPKPSPLWEEEEVFLSSLNNKTGGQPSNIFSFYIYP